MRSCCDPTSSGTTHPEALQLFSVDELGEYQKKLRVKLAIPGSVHTHCVFMGDRRSDL